MNHDKAMSVQESLAQKSIPCPRGVSFYKENHILYSEGKAAPGFLLNAMNSPG